MDFTLPTTRGQTRSVSQYRGRVVIVFYETRDTTSQNNPLKNAISRHIQADPALGRRFALVAVANVGEYAFWPAEHFAREAISAIANHNNVELWFDWSRALVRSLAMRDHVSNVLVLDRAGRVRVHRWGQLTASEIPVFLQDITAIADEPVAAAP